MKALLSDHVEHFSSMIEGDCSLNSQCVNRLGGAPNLDHWLTTAAARRPWRRPSALPPSMRAVMATATSRLSRVWINAASIAESRDRTATLARSNFPDISFATASSSFEHAHNQRQDGIPEVCTCYGVASCIDILGWRIRSWEPARWSLICVLSTQRFAQSDQPPCRVIGAPLRDRSRLAGRARSARWCRVRPLVARRCQRLRLACRARFR